MINYIQSSAEANMSVDRPSLKSCFCTWVTVLKFYRHYSAELHARMQTFHLVRLDKKKEKVLYPVSSLLGGVTTTWLAPHSIKAAPRPDQSEYFQW